MILFWPFVHESRRNGVVGCGWKSGKFHGILIPACNVPCRNQIKNFLVVVSAVVGAEISVPRWLINAVNYQQRRRGFRFPPKITALPPPKAQEKMPQSSFQFLLFHRHKHGEINKTQQHGEDSKHRVSLFTRRQAAKALKYYATLIITVFLRVYSRSVVDAW